MTKCIITIGISSSGKTTWARSQNANTVVISRDDIRRQILESKLGRELQPGELWKLWKFKNEDEVTAIWSIQVADFIKSKTPIICADTNLNEGRNQNLAKFFQDNGYEVEFKVFDVSLEEAFKRDAGRADGVGEAVIFRQWIQYHDLIKSKKYVPVPGTRKAIVCDIDGTIAHMKDRGPFDWSRGGEDELDIAVYHIVRGFYQQGYEIIFLSGRDSVCREKTENWLAKHNVPCTVLFMRAENDMRKDVIVKEELFFRYVAEHFDVEAVIDDRFQMITFWQRIGVKLINVGNWW